MNKKSGFTVIELLVVVVFLIAAGVLFTIQKAEIEATNRDEKRKTAINAMYFNLEEDYYKNNKNYPEKLTEENLKVMDPQLLTDPYGINVGEDNSDYRYEPTNCENGKCKSYTLRAELEKEDDFVKKSRN